MKTFEYLAIIGSILFLIFAAYPAFGCSGKKIILSALLAVALFLTAFGVWLAYSIGEVI